MIVSRSYGFLFVHNPKVAGSSLRKILLEYNDSDIEMWHQRYIPALSRLVDMSHLSADELSVVLNDYGMADAEGLFRFGFVRNPYSRFLSGMREFGRRFGIDFNSMTKDHRHAWIVANLTPSSIRYDWCFSHFRPQHYFFFEGHRRKADFIGRYHELYDDWATVRALLNIKDTQLPKERFESGEAKVDPNEWFNPETIAVINSLYGNDWILLAPYFTEKMIGSLPMESYSDRIHSIRAPIGRRTFYGEPPGLTVHEKLAFLTAEVERLRRPLSYIPT